MHPPQVPRPAPVVHQRREGFLAARFKQHLITKSLEHRKVERMTWGTDRRRSLRCDQKHLYNLLHRFSLLKKITRPRCPKLRTCVDTTGMIERTKFTEIP